MKDVICWAVPNFPDCEPVKCVCPDGFVALKDCILPNGEKERIYENTHFLRIEDAWAALADECRAWIVLEGSKVATAKAKLLAAEKIAAQAAERFAAVYNHPDNPKNKAMVAENEAILEQLNNPEPLADQ